MQEFGTGLKKEVEVANGSIGHVIDELGTIVVKGTTQITSQGKDDMLQLQSIKKKKREREREEEAIFGFVR